MVDGPKAGTRLSRGWAWAALGAMLAVYFGVVVYSSGKLSPAGDELLHVRAGAAYLTGGKYIDEQAAWWTRVDPLTPLADVAPGALALASGMPADTRAEIDIPFRHVRAARWANHIAGASMLVVLFAWGRGVGGAAGGLMAAAMCMAHPLFLAHATIVSSDLYGALGMVGLFAAMWWAWMAPRRALARRQPADGRRRSRYIKWLDPGVVSLLAGHRSWAPAALVGVVGWLAVMGKISNLALLAMAPVLAAAGGWWARPGVSAAKRRREALVCGLEGAAGVAGVAGILIAVSYALTGVHGGGDPIRAALSLEAVRDPWVWCNGVWNQAGPKLFLKVLALKSPLGWGLAAVAGTLATVALGARRRTTRPMLIVTVAVAAIYALFITRGFYLGLRHLLGPICLTAMLAAAGGRLPRARAAWARRTGWGLAAAIAAAWLAAVAATPDQLAYFNVLAGERPVMVDTDGDWGQGLRALARWQEEVADGEPIWLAYFGAARPEHYGVEYAGLPSPYGWVREDWRPEGEGPVRPEMLRGWVAISATHRVGALMPAAGLPREYYAAFGELEPAAVLRESIYIYDLRGTQGRPPAGGRVR